MRVVKGAVRTTLLDLLAAALLAMRVTMVPFTTSILTKSTCTT